MAALQRQLSYEEEEQRRVGVGPTPMRQDTCLALYASFGHQMFRDLGIHRLISGFCVGEFRPLGCLRDGRRLLGGQLLPQPVQASLDQLPVFVVANRADPSLRAVQVLARTVEIAELAVTLSQVEVQ